MAQLSVVDLTASPNAPHKNLMGGKGNMVENVTQSVLDRREELMSAMSPGLCLVSRVAASQMSPYH